MQDTHYEEVIFLRELALINAVDNAPKAEEFFRSQPLGLTVFLYNGKPRNADQG